MAPSVGSYWPQFLIVGEFAGAEMKICRGSPVYSFEQTEENIFRKTLWKKVKLLKMSNFTFFHNVFYAICILKSFNSHISVVLCSSFEFRTVSKWCNGEWVNSLPDNENVDLSKLKAFAENKLNMIKMMVYLFLIW